MAVFKTPGGETVTARGAMAGLFRQRGWVEVTPGSDAPSPAPEPDADDEADDSGDWVDVWSDDPDDETP